MSKIDYQALRELAKQATQGEWVAFISPGKYGTYAVHTPGDNHHGDIVDWPGFDEQKNAENNARYIAAFNPEVVQALLDERERNLQYIKSRDQENEDIALTVGKLRVELEAANKRIAELEAREILLPERSGMLHRTDFHDDYQTVMAYKVSEVIDAIRATGIRIKGEEHGNKTRR